MADRRMAPAPTMSKTQLTKHMQDHHGLKAGEPVTLSKHDREHSLYRIDHGHRRILLSQPRHKDWQR